MKKHGTELIKKPFKRWDIVVYAILSVVVALTFLTALLKPNEAKDGFTVTLVGREVLTCTFADKSVKIVDADAVEKIDESTYRIQSEKGYNVIEIDFENKSVAVIDADCVGKECARMLFDDGVIICAPHSLTIRPTGVESVPRVG